MDTCPTWYKPYPVAMYWGSASNGLGFFHIETGGKEDCEWLNFGNVGLVLIEKGEITKKELGLCFSDMWKTNWPWQIRRYDEKKFIVRFPRNKKIKDLVEYPSINLKKEGVTISFSDWNGEMPAYVTLEETWIVIEGLPPKWISWNIISQISTMLGDLVNVDWHTIFRSFYEKVRIQVAVRDSTKIPRDTIVEIHHELYLLKFTVESEAVSGHESDNPPGPDDNNPSQNKHTEEEFDSSGDDLLGEDMDTGNSNTNTKDKHQTTGSNGARTMQKCSTPAPRANEENLVSSKLLGAPMTKSYLEAVKKRHYDTMVTPLLEQFEAAADKPISQKYTSTQQKWGPVVAFR
uniref:Uncharacterized protein n=1 Tax=Aegilops tauschii subsp. strangulata TaxID=200361 RepID=A0A453LFG4_AEGTS